MTLVFLNSAKRAISKETSKPVLHLNYPLIMTDKAHLMVTELELHFAFCQQSKEYPWEDLVLPSLSSGGAGYSLRLNISLRLLSNPLEILYDNTETSDLIDD